MRNRIVVALMLALVVVGAAIPAASAVRVAGPTLVLFGDGAWYRSDAVIAGVEQALSRVPGVTVLIPRSRPSSLRDADLSAVSSVVEIYVAEVVARDEQSVNVSVGGIWASGVRTTVRVRLGLRFLRVIGNGQYLQFLGTGETEGSASGMTYVSAYIPSLGSVGISSVAALEADAFRNAAAILLGR